jgi:hypothetical protein
LVCVFLQDYFALFLRNIVAIATAAITMDAVASRYMPIGGASPLGDGVGEKGGNGDGDGDGDVEGDGEGDGDGAVDGDGDEDGVEGAVGGLLLESAIIV